MFLSMPRAMPKRTSAAELALDVLREAAGVRGASFVEEGFEMVGNDLVEERPLRVVLAARATQRLWRAACHQRRAAQRAVKKGGG
jgi:hypothetical protein